MVDLLRQGRILFSPMTQKAAQKAAIVTGGAQNIGLAIAKLLAQRGYRRLNSGSEPEFVSTYVAAEFGL